MMGELWDLYDINKIKVGRKHERGNRLNNGEYHLVTEIWVINNNREILLTKRHPDKRYGNLWEVPGGAVLSGEDSITGAKRELFEETGIDSKEDTLFLLGTLIRTDWIVDSYILKKNISIKSLKLQKEEVTDAKLVSVDEFEKMSLSELITPCTLYDYNGYRENIVKFMNENNYEF